MVKFKKIYLDYFSTYSNLELFCSNYHLNLNIMVSSNMIYEFDVEFNEQSEYRIHFQIELIFFDLFDLNTFDIEFSIFNHSV